VHDRRCRLLPRALRRLRPAAPGPEAPDYYLAYGEKYARRFSDETFKKLSPEGQHWLNNTFRLLQDRMEHLRQSQPVEFERLERDPDAFRRFAYETHSDAYLDAGLKDVDYEDLWHIVWTPDLADLATADGAKQAFVTAAGLGWQKAQDAIPDIERPFPDIFLRGRQVLRAEE